jgi:hypothetical protein
MTNILKTQKPCVVRSTGPFEDAIYSAFDCLVVTISWVLELLMGLRLPTLDTNGAENILTVFNDENSSRITKKGM